MKKLFALMLTLVLITSIFAGCGNGEADTSSDDETQKTSEASEGSNETEDDKSEEDNQSVELRIVTMFGGTDPSTEAFKQQLQDFMAENPHVTVVDESMTSVGDEFRTAVKTDFSTGNEADVTFSIQVLMSKESLKLAM